MTRSGSAFSVPVDPPPPGTPWTVLQLLRWSSSYLDEKGVPGSRLDAEHLLASILGMDRLQLYLHFDRPVSQRELERFKPLLLARARRKPIQYILGRTGFRELELKTDSRALIPRPETELLVEAVLERVRGWDVGGLRALDVGTGSGAIALSLALEGPFERVVGTDSLREALELAAENAEACTLQERVELRWGRAFDPVREGESYHVVVSNPPYVADGELEGLEPEVRDWEPREALAPGGDGLSVLRELVRGAGAVLEHGGLLALEVGSGQAEVVAEWLRGAPGFGVPVVLKDHSRHDRIVVASRTGALASDVNAGPPGERPAAS